MDFYLRQILIGTILVAWFFFVVLKIRSPRAFKEFILSFSGSGSNQILSEYLSVLTANTFFNKLSREGRELFIRKCGRFIMSKRFVGMEGLEVTREMKIKIAATAVQVTYGLKDSSFSHYHTVKIFPESFYSGLHDKYLKGGASTGGSLLFSWKDFEMGFSDPTDRYNLGLHEMAHALRLQIKHGKDFDVRFASYADQWVEMALPEFERMNKGNTSFLREYGGTNIEEFFAVCVEHFFEVPFEFREHLPDIYNHLCFLLNQDPTRISDDYKLAPGFVASVNSDPARMPLPLKLSRAYHYDAWHWSFNFIIAGLFLGVPALFLLYGKVLFTIWHVWLAIAVVTALIVSFHSFFRQKGMGHFRHLLFFSIAGAGPLVTALFLLSNYLVKSDYSTASYQVVDARRFLKQEPEGNSAYYLLQLKNDVLKAYPEIRTIPAGMIKAPDSRARVYLTVTTSKGIWGLENFEDKAIIVSEKTENKD